MPLPHYLNLGAITDTGGVGSKPQEPVYLNLFEISFILPTVLTGRDPFMLLKQATNVNVSQTNKSIGSLTQQFKYSKRIFLQAGPADTTVDLSIKFNVNVNEGGSMESWETLKTWYDLAWNSQNGFLHYKADMIGTIIVNQHDKKGLVLRRFTFQNCQLYDLNYPNLDWTSTTILDTTAKFKCDYWIDEYITPTTGITPPFVYP
jgi:hypothetical protein